MQLSAEAFQELAAAAREASTLAYCPYSNFRVGAAVWTGDEEIVPGCNIENASYGLTLCAERVAIFQAIARGSRAFKAIVVYTPTAAPTAPCGACRQVLNEFAPDLDVICICDGTEVLDRRLSELLPDAFGPDNLGRSA